MITSTLASAHRYSRTTPPCFRAVVKNLSQERHHFDRRVNLSNLTMDLMQEILETVREIRKGQLEQAAWRKRYLLKVRIISILLGFPEFIEGLHD